VKRMKEELKREVDIREFECPFCGHKKIEKLHDRIINTKTGEVTGYSIDYWECDKCGAANDIELDNFENEFEIFRQFTNKDDWEGLYEFCKSNEYDEFTLICLAKLYNQQRHFSKAIKITEIILRLDSKDPDAKIIMDNAKRGIKNGREKN